MRLILLFTKIVRALLLPAWSFVAVRAQVYELIDDPSSNAGHGLLRLDTSKKPALLGLKDRVRSELKEKEESSSSLRRRFAGR